MIDHLTYAHKAGTFMRLVVLIALSAGVEAGMPKVAHADSSARTSQIAFLGSPHGEGMDDAELFMVEPDGSDLRQLTHNRFYEGQVSWSPDGRYLAYSLGSWLADNDIYLVEVESGAERRLTTGGEKAELAWSKDGKSIAYLDASAGASNQSGNYYSIDIVTLVRTWLAAGSPESLVPGYQALPDYLWPQRSPNGRSIAEIRSTIADMHPDQAPSYIAVMDADGTSKHIIADKHDPEDDYFSMAWSPDSTRIAFSETTVASRGMAGPNRVDDIYVIEANGSNLHRLQTHGGVYPSWSPDGQQIVYEEFHDNLTQIYIMNADGSNQHAITQTTFNCDRPVWSH